MAAGYHLIVRNGPQRGSAIPIDETPVLIGRDPECTLILQDPLVSRRHCEVQLDGPHLVVNDLNSSNCTLVNGRPISTTRLHVGDEISVGTSSILITRHLQPIDAPLSKGSSETVPVIDLWHAGSQQPRDGLPRNVNDLARLLAELRRFSLADTTATLLRCLEVAIRERLQPKQVWVSLLHGDVLEHVTRPVGNGTPEPPNTLLYASIHDDRPQLTTRGGSTEGIAPSTVMVVPIGLAGDRFGAVAVERAPGSDAYDEDDLNYLIGLARGAAPFFRTLERTRQLERDVVRFQSERRESLQFIGASEAAQKLLYLIRIVARSDQPILIIGETGTGKELVATLIHELSERARGPMVAVNCAAIPHELFESEVFGHERGAFTGAVARRAGLLEQSDGGTLFLDEVGDLHPSHQARLLRAVETHTFRRVGGNKDLQADFRIVAATNKNLVAAVQAGSFREDLFHRLKGLQLNVPPLRDRPDDIPALAEHFLAEALRSAKRPLRGFTDGALGLLRCSPWPGNVRELKNCVETAVTLAPGEQVDEHLLQLILGEQRTMPQLRSLAEVERSHIEQVLRACDGKIVEAARILGIGRSTLYDKVNSYGITRPNT